MAFKVRKKKDQSDHGFVQAIVDASMHTFRGHPNQTELARNHARLRLKVIEKWDEDYANLMVSECFSGNLKLNWEGVVY